MWLLFSLEAGCFRGISSLTNPKTFSFTIWEVTTGRLPILGPLGAKLSQRQNMAKHLRLLWTTVQPIHGRCICYSWSIYLDVFASSFPINLEQGAHLRNRNHQPQRCTRLLTRQTHPVSGSLVEEAIQKIDMSLLNYSSYSKAGILGPFTSLAPLISSWVAAIHPSCASRVGSWQIRKLRKIQHSSNTRCSAVLQSTAVDHKRFVMKSS